MKKSKPVPRTFSLTVRPHTSKNFGDWRMVHLIMDDADGRRAVLCGQLTVQTTKLVTEWATSCGVQIEYEEAVALQCDPINGHLF